MLARYSAIKPAFLTVMMLAGSLSFFQAANAQGLGEITLESSLHEPLRASIDLQDVSGLSADDVNISVASASEYEQAGLQRSLLISQIAFDVELFPLGRGQVTLTTEDRVEEPYLSLLISARWPSGRVLREYTLLVDLPTFSENQASGQAVSAPAVSRSASASAANNASTQTENFTVRSGDTMWEIAEQTRPANDITVQQMMIAIQRANEDAFVNNNINRLLNGRVLRIPNRQEISIIGHSAAVAQINAQNQDLGLMRLDSDGAVTGTAPRRDELSVISAEDAESSAGSSDLEASIEALENELMLSEENLDRALLENRELTNQLAELEEQIDILQNIIAIEDERIAQLQAELEAQAEATEQALATASAAAQTLAQAEQSAAPQGMVAKVMSLLQNNLIFIGGALAVVLLALGFLVMKSRAAGADEDDLELDDDEPEKAGPRGATPLEDEDEEAPGFFASLFARFKKDDEEDDFDDEDDSVDLSLEASAISEDDDSEDADSEDDDSEDDSDEDVLVEEEEGDYSSDDEDEDEDDEAEVLASDVMDEVENALQEIDGDDDQAIPADEVDEEDELEIALGNVDGLDGLDPVELDETEDEAEDEASSEQVDDIELEFDLDIGDDEEAETLDFSVDEVADTEQEEAEPEEDAESFEFSLKKEDEPADSEQEEPDDELESFNFSLSDSEEVDIAEPEEAEPEAASEELETLDFASTSEPAEKAEPEAADEQDFGFGNLTFDENDVQAEADDEDLEQQVRTDMDECDTKLDLAVAYEAMGDIDGALEILEEVINEGKPAQIEEAQRLQTKWQES